MAPADILIRGGIELNIISIGSTHAVTSAQRISVNAESTLDEYPLNDIRREDIMIFPGGMPGTSNLAECICAAPGLVLSMLPLEKVVEARGSLRMTCYEGFEPALTAKGVTIIDQRDGVVKDGNIISASGPGHAVAFGLKILEHIAGTESSETIAKALML